MKGILITLCSISQIGKDYIAENLKKELEVQAGKDVVYPTVYKTRNKRVSDPENLICVEREGDIPKEFSLRYLVHGEQVVAYSENEIAKALEEGKIVILTSGSVSAVQKLKKDFGEDCISVRVMGGYKNEKQIAQTEAKRYGLDVNDQKVQASAKSRFENFGYMKSELEDYEADYDIINYWSINKYLESGPNSLLGQIRDLAGEVALRMEEKNSIEN